MSVGNFSLRGKIAVVTGAGSGINLAFAKLAVGEGARVLVADLRLTEDGENFMSEQGPKAAVFVKCDVTKRADLENLIAVSEKEFGDVPDVYVPGAGVFEPAWSNFWDDTEDDGYAQVDINVTHPLKLSRIAIRALLGRKKKGVILITASMAGFGGQLSAALYCTTKHAIVGFVRSMEQLDALEGIKVVAIAPGLVRTPLWTDRPEKMKQWGYTIESSVSVDEVAKSMIELVIDGQYGGGTCLMINPNETRTLGTWNVAPPASYSRPVTEEATALKLEPILAKLKEERGN